MKMNALSVHNFMLTRAGTCEICSVSEHLFLISSFKDYLRESISYKCYVIKYMIRNYYRILLGNLEGSIHVPDISL